MIMTETTQEARIVAVIGAGTIGQSWARLFASHGLTVVLSDPRPDLEEVAATVRAEVGGDPSLIRVATSLQDAVAGADHVQENGPELRKSSSSSSPTSPRPHPPTRY